jgi:predicted secreted protein
VPAGVKGNVENAAERTEPSLKKLVCWEKTYGGYYNDELASIVRTFDGGYLAAGYTKSKGAGGKDAWILKLDSEGRLKGEVIYGDIFKMSKADDEISSIVRIPNRTYVFTGYTMSKGAGGGDLWFLKIDSRGNILKERPFGGSMFDGGFSIAPTYDGNYIIAGSTMSKGAGQLDGWVLKVSPKGARGRLVWEKTFGGSNNDAISSIRQVSDEGYIAAGYTMSKGTIGRDAWILKLDSQGNLEWDKTFGDDLMPDGLNSIIQTQDESYIAVGSKSSEDFTPDGWLIKLRSNGSLEWQKTFGGDGSDNLFSVVQTYDNGYLAVGYSSSKGKGNDGWILKLDPSGKLEWSKVFGGDKDDRIFSVQPIGNQKYIAAGYTMSKGAGKKDGWVLKFDLKGRPNCQ